MSLPASPFTPRQRRMDNWSLGFFKRGHALGGSYNTQVEWKDVCCACQNTPASALGLRELSGESRQCCFCGSLSPSLQTDPWLGIREKTRRVSPEEQRQITSPTSCLAPRRGDAAVNNRLLFYCWCDVTLLAAKANRFYRSPTQMKMQVPGDVFAMVLIKIFC